MRLLLATLLGLGCTSAYRQNVLGTLKAKQAELRDHPDPRPAGLPRANQLLGMLPLIEEWLRSPSPCSVLVPIARGFDGGSPKVSNTSTERRRCHTHEVLHLTPRWVFLDRFRGLAPASRVS